MSKIKDMFFAGTMAGLIVVGISASAYADNDVVDGVTLNDATNSIPFKETVNAGSSVDMNGITYTIDVARQTYAAEKGAGVYDDGPEPLGTANPIVIKPAETAKATDGDFTDEWELSRSLTELFGSVTNFPRAGMYEYTIKQTHADGSSNEPGKWDYNEPEYLLQVLVKTDSADVSNRVYAGWTLSKWDADQGKYVKVNSGGDGDPNGSAAFSETYKAKSQLNVTKQVKGDYASTTYQFPQTITVTLPEWYDESRDGTILPGAGTPETTDGVTITRKSTDGNTIIFETALAHGQTASLTVPVGTRYEVKETTDGEGTSHDAAGLGYTPKIDWSVDNGKHVAQKTMKQLTITDYTYEQAVEILNNLKVVGSNGELDTHAFHSVNLNQYNNTNSVDMGIISSYNNYSSEDSRQVSEVHNIWANGASQPTGLSRLGFDLYTHVEEDGVTVESSDMNLTDFAIVYDGTHYTIDPANANGSRYEYHLYDYSEGELVNGDLMNFLASLANGLAKGEVTGTTYISDSLEKPWGIVRVQWGQVQVKITTENASDLATMSNDILDVARTYVEKTGSSSFNISVEPPASMTAFDELGISTYRGLYDYIASSSAWSDWMSSKSFAVTYISEAAIAPNYWGWISIG